MEDLYVDGQPAGQVGQEIYGAGSAFVFASRAFHRVEGAPFLLFCDHFLLGLDRPGEKALRFQLAGSPGRDARLSLIRAGSAGLPEFTLSAHGGKALRPRHASAGRIEYHVPADATIELLW